MTGKSSPSPPPPPDPYAVGQAQYAMNADTARLMAGLNRVNQNTPWGSISYSQDSGPQFNQSAYDSAMDAWQRQQAGLLGPSGYTAYDGEGQSIYTVGGYAPGGGGAPAAAVAAPTREQFTTPGSDQWTANVTLAPEQQRLLDAQNRMALSLSGIGERGLDRIDQAMGTPFDTSALRWHGRIPESFQGVSGVNTAGMQGFRGNVDTGGMQGYDASANSPFAIQGQVDLRGAPGMLNPGAFNQAGNIAQQAVLSRTMPQLAWAQDRLNNQLSNQGIMPGSEAAQRAQQEFGWQMNDQLNQAALRGFDVERQLYEQALRNRQQYTGEQFEGGQFANLAQQQGFAQDLAVAQLANQVRGQQFAEGMSQAQLANAVRQMQFGEGLNQANLANQVYARKFQEGLAGASAMDRQRQQQMQEQAFLRQLPLNELNALRTGSQVTSPQFTPVPGTAVAPTDLAGNIYRSYQGDINAYNQGIGQQNQMMSGLFGLGAAYLMGGNPFAKYSNPTGWGY